MPDEYMKNSSEILRESILKHLKTFISNQELTLI